MSDAKRRKVDSDTALLASLKSELAEFHTFWSGGGIDEVHGGFMTALDHAGKLLSEDKFIWYQGRGLWVYSHLYRLHGRDPKHLAIAKNCHAFIIGKWADPSTGEWAVQTGRIGAADTKLAHEHGVINTSGYGRAFIAEGLAEYHRASGDASALALALAELDKFHALIEDPEHSSDTHLPLKVTGGRCLGHQMIMLSLTRQLLEAPAILPSGSPEETRVIFLNDQAVERITTRFHHPKYDLMGEVLTHDWLRPDDANEDFFYLGHGIETLWMLMAEAARRDDRTTYRWAARLFKRHVEVAWDPVHGGVFRGLSVTGQSFLIDADCKVKWAQDEVVVGCRLLIEYGSKYGVPGDDEPFPDLLWADRMLARMLKYIDDKFAAPLRERGYPYVLVGGDREVSFAERYVNAGQPGAPSRKEHYHHPRMLMLMIESLQRTGVA